MATSSTRVDEQLDLGRPGRLLLDELAQALERGAQGGDPGAGLGGAGVEREPGAQLGGEGVGEPAGLDEVDAEAAALEPAPDELGERVAGDEVDPAVVPDLHAARL